MYECALGHGGPELWPSAACLGPFSASDGLKSLRAMQNPSATNTYRVDGAHRHTGCVHERFGAMVELFWNGGKCWDPQDRSNVVLKRNLFDKGVRDCSSGTAGTLAKAQAMLAMFWLFIWLATSCCMARSARASASLKLTMPIEIGIGITELPQRFGLWHKAASNKQATTRN